MPLLRTILLVGATLFPHTATAASVHLGTGATVPKKDVGHVDLTRLPLGDSKTSSSPQRGSIDLCPGIPTAPSPDSDTLPWVHGSTWNLMQKQSVSGSVAWPQATFSNTVTDGVRLLAGNDLPVGHTTGVFPATSGYRPDPTSITAHDISLRLPATPTVDAQPTCAGMEVGVTLDGVELFNGFDAQLRDAIAQEVEDRCDGHPNQSGYHRHWIPTCFKDPGHGQSRLMGYALDGFGIYGHRGPHGKVMTNADLDACHGITSRVKWNGRWVRMYHYVATWEFPYTVGCFRGTPAVRGPAF